MSIHLNNLATVHHELSRKEKYCNFFWHFHFVEPFARFRSRIERFEDYEMRQCCLTDYLTIKSVILSLNHVRTKQRCLATIIEELLFNRCLMAWTLLKYDEAIAIWCSLIKIFVDRDASRFEKFDTSRFFSALINSIYDRVHWWAYKLHDIWVHCCRNPRKQIIQGSRS